MQIQETSTLRQLSKQLLQKYYLSILLLIIAALSFTSAYVALPAAFIFTLLVPGLAAYKFLKLNAYETIAFIPIFSVLASVQLVYYLSLFMDYSSTAILASFIILAVAHFITDWKKPPQFSFKHALKRNPFSKTTTTIFLLIFIIAAYVLFQSVWRNNQAGIVITGSNWQDTPLHYEIIESINNGNFPPENPFYSGTKMSYHYFVDFHTAIIAKTCGFLPTLLPALNAIFILIFAITAYTLTRPYGEQEANYATVIAVFGWGFSFFLLVSAITNGQFNAAQNYAYQYNSFFGLPPIFDNLLQQRPLLVGLPTFALVLTLLRNSDDQNKILIAGILTGLVFPFHVFSFICACVAYFLALLTQHVKPKKRHLLFFISIPIALPFLANSNATTSITFAPLWALMFIKENPFSYYVMNLGIPFITAIISTIKLKEKLLQTVFITLFLIPNILSISPNPWDMYKFFTFAWVPIAALTGIALRKTQRIIAFILVAITILPSLSVILYNIGTSYTAATWDEYNLGMWIRNNTEEKAVFLTYYSIHSVPTMIGGRLRVAAYINWAYGHGIPLEDIYERFADIDKAYNGTEEELKQTILKYNITYIYVGREEQKHYPQCISRFDQISWLKQLNNGTLKIYKVYL
ncbi:MAG: DUF2298 domain-containing protein [Candidatus Bathyarchaeia archaeon]